MVQTSDSNLRGTLAFWLKKYCRFTQWTNWIDQLHLVIIAKENLDKDNIREPLELETEVLILEGTQDSENETQRKAKEARNKEPMRVYENAEDKRIMEQKRKLDEMRRKQTNAKKDQSFTWP